MSHPDVNLADDANLLGGDGSDGAGVFVVDAEVVQLVASRGVGKEHGSPVEVEDGSVVYGYADGVGPQAIQLWRRDAPSVDVVRPRFRVIERPVPVFLDFWAESCGPRLQRALEANRGDVPSGHRALAAPPGAVYAPTPLRLSR